MTEWIEVSNVLHISESESAQGVVGGGGGRLDGRRVRHGMM